MSATAVTAPSHPTSRSTTAPRALKPGAAPRAATPPSPSTAPVVIGSGGVVGPAPLRIATTSNWAPLVVVLLLLCLVSTGCMSAAKVCPAEVAAGRLTPLECEALVAQRNAAVTNKWVGIIGVAAALDNSHPR